MKDKIIQEIIELISVERDIPKEKIHSDSNFNSDLGIDSLDMMELVFVIEDKYNLHLTCTPSEIKTIDDLAKIISNGVAEL
jgi:acyl carrier protein